MLLTAPQAGKATLDSLPARRSAPSASAPQLYCRHTSLQSSHTPARHHHCSKRQPLVVCFAAPASVPEFTNDTAAVLKPLPRAVENIADDPSLHNPLQRLHRLGPGWMGVILEYEGVIVEDTSELHSKAWEALSKEEGKSRPLHWALKRAEGMKSEQVKHFV